MDRYADRQTNRYIMKQIDRRAAIHLERDGCIYYKLWCYRQREGFSVDIYVQRIVTQIGRQTEKQIGRCQACMQIEREIDRQMDDDVTNMKNRLVEGWIL